MSTTQVQSKFSRMIPASPAVRRRYLTFLILVAPALLLRLLTAGYPFIQTAYLSLTNVDFLAGTDEFIGLQNFARITRDFGVRSAVNFTVIFVVSSTVLQLILGILVALMLNANFRGRQFTRAVNLVPWAIPTIVAAYAFRWILDDQFGMIPHWISLVTGTRPVFFISADSARIVTILVNVWKNTPFMAVIFLAGLQSVPEDLYDAAKVDGAHALHRFWYVTIPFVLPLLISTGMFFIVWQMASFDLIYGLTSGGPGTATSVMALRIFEQGLLFFKFGFASAIGVVMLGLVGIVGIVGVLLFRRFEITL
jgi:multiple sugar transport system permease protein